LVNGDLAPFRCAIRNITISFMELGWNLDCCPRDKHKKNSNLFEKNLTLLCNIDGNNTKKM
jgi:hypothetical protein